MTFKPSQFFYDQLQNTIAETKIKSASHRGPNTYLSLLVKYKENQTIGVKLDGNSSAIVINNDFENFDKIVKIYNNPQITPDELFNLNLEILEFASDSDVKTYLETPECHLLHYNHYQQFLVELEFIYPTGI